MKLIYSLILFFAFSIIVNAQNYQQKIIGNWVRDDLSISIVYNGTRYDNVISNKEDDDRLAEKFSFKSNGILEVNLGYIEKGRYVINGNNLTLSYAPWGSSESEDQNYSITVLSEKELVLTQTEIDVLAKEDAEWLYSIPSFNNIYKNSISSLIGKRVSFVITIHHKKQL